MDKRGTPRGALQDHPCTVAGVEPTNWSAVFDGQGVEPEGYDPLARAVPPDKLRATLQRMRETIARGVDAAPVHGEFVAGIARSQAER